MTIWSLLVSCLVLALTCYAVRSLRAADRKITELLAEIEPPDEHSVDHRRRW